MGLQGPPGVCTGSRNLENLSDCRLGALIGRGPPGPPGAFRGLQGSGVSGG